MQLEHLICVVLMCTVYVSSNNINQASNDVSTPPDEHMGQSDALSSLGDITTKLVTTLVESADEKVDIYGMADLITALSKAATIVEHPNMYKEMLTNDHEEQLHKVSSIVKVLAEQQRSLQETIDVQQERLLVIDEMAFALNESQALITRLEEQLEDKELSSGQNFVGFTAWADVSARYKTSDTIRFPQVLFNYGSGYDRSTGKFSCPISGVYSVNVHLEEMNSGGLIIDAMLDSTSFFRVHVHPDSNEHGTSATSAIVGCRQGQTIYMRTQDSGISAEVQYTEKRSVFSIYLVKAMSTEDVRGGSELMS